MASTIYNLARHGVRAVKPETLQSYYAPLTKRYTIPSTVRNGAVFKPTALNKVSGTPDCNLQRKSEFKAFDILGQKWIHTNATSRSRPTVASFGTVITRCQV